MEKYDQKSFGLLVKGVRNLNETTIESLIHFVRVFEVYPIDVWINCVLRGNTPRKILILGAKHPDPAVRWHVAGNLKTPVDLLEMLAKDKDEFVRQQVGGNPKTPADVLEILAREKRAWTRWNVASNPNTPADVLERFAGDDNQNVREAAQREIRRRQNGKI